MRFHRFDLNLLAALDALLSTCSVTAAERTSLLQGSASRAPEHPSALELQDGFPCVVRTGHARMKEQLTLAHYLPLDHAVTRYGFDRRPGFERFELNQLGIECRIDVACTMPTLLAPLAMGTQRIATMPTHLARKRAACRPIKLFEPRRRCGRCAS